MQTYNIYYIRHAHACNNVSKHFKEYSGKDIDQIKEYIPDAILTNKGVIQSRTMNKKINIIPDVIITSELIRTIETGLEIFKDKIDKIHVVPFISEKRQKFAFGEDIDNQAWDSDVLEKYINDKYNDDYPKVDFSILKHFKPYSHNLKTEPDEIKLYIDLIPHIVDKLRLPNNANIFLISHANFINSHFIKRHDNMTKVDNAEMKSERVTYFKDKIVFDRLQMYHKIFYDNNNIDKIDEKDICRCYKTDNGHKFKHEFKVYKIDG
jgi:broad specificity phosphatase PhoE